MAQLTLDELNGMEEAAFVAALGNLFEHAPWVARAAHASRPFSSVAALYMAMTEAVRASGNERQNLLIGGHPDLAGKAAREGSLTPDSTLEQASAGLDHLSEQEFAEFHRLNDAYRRKFNFPFIICVRRHGKESILREFARRLRNDPTAEHAAALSEIYRIVALRLDQRVTAPDRLNVNGRLSTHVLDTYHGRPASGVAIALYELGSAEKPRLILTTVTNADGRPDQPLVAEQPIPIGRYELYFGIGDYFAHLGTQLAEPPFLGAVPVRFAVAEPEGHYHVPLLVTPWSYTTYRGS